MQNKNKLIKCEKPRYLDLVRNNYQENSMIPKFWNWLFKHKRKKLK